MFKLLILYFVLLNFISFVFFGIDKFKAKWGSWRISENMLLSLTLAGGFVGSILGMIMFSHKTAKSSFQLRFWPIIIIWIGVLFYILFNYNGS